MKLFKICIRHCAPRDTKESLVNWVIAPDATTVLHYIDKELMHGSWTDTHNDSLNEPLEIYNEDYDVIGTEFYLEKMLRLRGEYFDPDANYDDAYYGVTHYGWEEGIEISEEDKETLLKLGVAIELKT